MFLEGRGDSLSQVIHVVQVGIEQSPRFYAHLGSPEPAVGSSAAPALADRGAVGHFASAISALSSAWATRRPAFWHLSRARASSNAARAPIRSPGGAFPSSTTATGKADGA